jgi:hypothetical protein
VLLSAAKFPVSELLAELMLGLDQLVDVGQDLLVVHVPTVTRRRTGPYADLTDTPTGDDVTRDATIDLFENTRGSCDALV